MNVAWFYADLPAEYCTTRWRVMIPHQALQRVGVRSEVASIHELMIPPRQAKEGHHLAEWADVIVVERLFIEPFATAIRLWARAGKRLFGTFDDAYHLMPPYSPTKPTWTEEALRQFRRTLGLFEAVFVPSPVLAKDFAKHGNMVYIPNRPDLSDPCWQAAGSQESKVIGWGGTMQHRESWAGSGIVDALEKLCREDPEIQIWIVGSGCVPMYQLLNTSPAQKRLFPARPYSNYVALVARFDVGLAPLAGPYDQRRSWIKPLEYALLGVPWVASHLDVYGGVKGGFLTGKKGWYSAIKRALEERPQGKDWAGRQGIDEHIEEYMNVMGI